MGAVHLRDRSGRVIGGGRLLAIGLAAGAYAWWAVGLAPFSAGATLAVVGAGLAAVVAAGRNRRAGGRHVPLAAAAPWIALVLAATVVQLSAYVQQPRRDHPTLSSLTNELLDSHPARAAAFLAWLALTAALARR
jgi:hypothetical protein